MSDPALNSSALHQLMQQPLSAVLADTSNNLRAGDTVLAFGSHIAGLLDKQLQTRLQSLGLHLAALQTDAESLGLVSACEQQQVSLLTDSQWLELTLQHHPVYTY
ncbi:hypothetical protein SAMN06297229_1381 [Pseudidiomarina planktonica]|uniref:tRNA 2-thiouridine synthesizing protein B n=1 Tax=Pseudidiomarina planktonica TaxID=1323738 RepID=A0A1Y6EZD2_9GAMM|nr:hypothetical protein [Pseudidiomarina planktonica]RUO65238.1 hypothetical protein CWI77_01865 [Pseudidiomarina planktonica]SMQ65872.1 hypothetical protein SAMN06297229_1381 [Pseudidiomarina planktonica]